jgi:hypothetical protein
MSVVNGVSYVSLSVFSVEVKVDGVTYVFLSVFPVDVRSKWCNLCVTECIYDRCLYLMA